MTRLQNKANIPDSDSFYEEFLDLHQGCSRDESDALNVSLILLLANHIGDHEVLREAMQVAAQVVLGSKPEP
ncbi:MAG: DUF2783 domain-containing protein [Holophagales bacterium]|nr:DUF2783 domain-containing protein [Acidobacteriota bacterium]MYB18871.1 DUF2783 domain-containing protein [Holophagales bacterium]MYH26971.1 DUF2783 domain-containing protein [Holophagales bacterium]